LRGDSLDPLTRNVIVRRFISPADLSLDGLAGHFWTRVDRRGPSDCWPWRQASRASGYGIVWWCGHQVYAHRVAWCVSRGSWPTRLVCHHCDNRMCVNPAHLFEGTDADNCRDKISKGRGTPPPHRKGEAVNLARLTRGQVLEIRAGQSDGESHAALAERFGVAESTVWAIVHRRTWAWL
jgi:hypothetical protein